MVGARHSLLALGVTALVLLAGCGGFVGNSSSPAADQTVTPAPVPVDDQFSARVLDQEAQTSVSHGPNGRALVGSEPGRRYWAGITAENRSEVVQPRYLSLRPTCERPPTLVVQIQLGALLNNDPTTDEGIHTTWHFTAPSTQRDFDSYSAFVDTIVVQYQPLLDAETVAYGQFERNGTTATQRVTVQSERGAMTVYDWQLEKQTSGRYEGCWMTTHVSELGDQTP